MFIFDLLLFCLYFVQNIYFILIFELLFFLYKWYQMIYFILRTFRIKGIIRTIILLSVQNYQLYIKEICCLFWCVILFTVDTKCTFSTYVANFWNSVILWLDSVRLFLQFSSPNMISYFQWYIYMAYSTTGLFIVTTGGWFSCLIEINMAYIILFSTNCHQFTVK